MNREYVEKHDGGYWVAGTRVSLDSIVYKFLRGESAEGIARSFPVLSLEEIYGAIAYYLGNQAEVDETMATNDREFEILRQQARVKNRDLYKKVEQARQQLQLPRR